MFDYLLDRLAGADPLLLHLGAFFLAFGETAMFLDFVVPGEVGLVVVGAASGRADSPLWTLIAAASLGATLGDSVSYWLGRRFGLDLVCKWSFLRRRLEPAVERAQQHFERRGAGVTIFLGRFVGAARAVVPAVAGMARMPYLRFLPWNAAASVAWTTVVISLGYAFGRHIGGIVGDVGLAISAVVVVGATLWWFVRRRRRDAGARRAIG